MDGRDQHRGHDADRDGYEQVHDPRAVVQLEVGHLEPGRLEPAPVAEAEEDHVADRGRDEARDQRGGEPRAERPRGRLGQHHAGHERAAEQRRDRGERPGQREHSPLAVVERRERRQRDRDDRPECDHGRLRAEHEPEAEGAERGEHDTGRVRQRRGGGVDAAERAVAAVAGQERARRPHDGAPHDRQPEHEVPRRARLAERVGEIGPQPVLKLVHEAEEHRRHGGRGNAHERGEPDEFQVGHGRIITGALLEKSRR
jgi:hypothetical protein